jgi:16S rRNA (uracil1498-N3)-methyltransferase
MAPAGTTALGGPDGRGGPHVFVADLDRPALGDEDRHHLQRVVRLRPGDTLTVSDGAGAWVPCRFGDELEVVGNRRIEQRRVPEVALGFVPVKGDRPEWVVQKATELGVDRMVVLRSERSVVRWEGDRARRQIERLVKVAREAAMQCRRCHLPVLEGVVDLSEVADRAGVVRADLGGGPPSLDRSFVLVGPEGGWSPGEADRIPATVGLADHVLRAETAAVTAVVRLAALRADGGNLTTRVHTG